MKDFAAFMERYAGGRFMACKQAAFAGSSASSLPRVPQWPPIQLMVMMHCLSFNGLAIPAAHASSFILLCCHLKGILLLHKSIRLSRYIPITPVSNVNGISVYPDLPEQISRSFTKTIFHSAFTLILFGQVVWESSLGLQTITLDPGIPGQPVTN